MMPKLCRKMTFIDDEKSGGKNDKNRPKNDPLKIHPKVAKKQFPRGGPKWQKSIKFDGGVRGGQFYKFFEIFHFFAKTFGFRTPKNDPYKMSIPHK
jgi:hypothetical protein